MVRASPRGTGLKRSIVDSIFREYPEFRILPCRIAVESAHISSNDQRISCHAEANAISEEVRGRVRSLEVGVYRHRTIGNTPWLLVRRRPDRNPGSPCNTVTHRRDQNEPTGGLIVEELGLSDAPIRRGDQSVAKKVGQPFRKRLSRLAACRPSPIIQVGADLQQWPTRGQRRIAL